jgi:hypothetical protein
MILFILLFSFNVNANKADFTACKSTYALCTTALCQPIPGKKGSVTCFCDVKTGYSAGTRACSGVIESKHKQEISSRYYPIKAYERCSNDRPWAFCLDSPCIIDSINPSKALCLCSLLQNQGDYVAVKEGQNPTSCTSGIYSSATVDDINQITDFLKGQTDLQPYKVKVSQ